MGVFFLHLWGLVFAIPGACMVFYAFRNAIKGHASREWQQSECVVRRSFVQVTVDQSNSRSMSPSLEYEYQFNGETLKGTRIRYGQIGTGSRTAAEKVLLPYPVGARVPLFVNPDKPQECTLVVGMSWGNVFNLVAGLIFIACGYALMQVKK